MKKEIYCPDTEEVTFQSNHLLIKILITIAFCFAFTMSRAQYVTIPDAHFVTWLNTHGFSNCMNGNQLDTTCNEVVNTTYIECNNADISDLTGINYFDNLTTLECNRNPLILLPAFPPILQHFGCDQNGWTSLSSLPNFPSTLTYFSYMGNYTLTALPALPPSLSYLKCGASLITSLPPLPASLKELSVGWDWQLASLPTLPDSLIYLDISVTAITSLATVPATLKSFICLSTPITSLPTLPDTLDNLWIYSCPNLTCLPPIHQITTFYWYDTPITCLPNLINVGSSDPSVEGVPICSSTLNPPTIINVTGGSSKVSSGDTRIYTTGVDTSVTFQWTVPEGASINNGQGTHSINVTYNSNFDCSGVISVKKTKDCAISESNNITILKKAPKTPSTIIGINTGLCGRQNVVYSVQAEPGITYNWTVPSEATILSGQGTNSIIVNFQSTNFLKCISVSANRCGTSFPRIILVRSTAAAPTTIYGNSTVCSNSIGQTYSIAPISFATNYTWKAPLGSHITANGINSLNNTLTTTSNTITVNFGAVNFLSSISVQANNNCGSGTKKYLFLSPCSQREAVEPPTSDICIYPNPSSGIYTLAINSSTNTLYTILVYDLLGKELTKEQLSVKEGFTAHKMDLQKLNPGLYCVTLLSTETKQLIKIIKN